MHAHISYLLFAFTSLFTIINPLGAMPFYSSLVEDVDHKEARMIALKATTSAFIAMVLFALSGNVIFAFFNVSVDGLRIVGGVLFFVTGYDMLQGREARTKSVSASERVSDQDIKIKAITPLAIPLICGPGTITVLTVLVQESQDWIQRSFIFLSALTICALTFFILVGSKRIMAFIGISGQKVFFRLMGLILMMIAVEFFFSGIRPYVRSLF